MQNKTKKSSLSKAINQIKKQSNIKYKQTKQTPQVTNKTQKHNLVSTPSNKSINNKHSPKVQTYADVRNKIDIPLTTGRSDQEDYVIPDTNQEFETIPENNYENLYGSNQYQINQAQPMSANYPSNNNYNLRNNNYIQPSTNKYENVQQHSIDEKNNMYYDEDEENDKIEDEMYKLKNEIDQLKLKSTKTKEKLSLFIKLIRKYANKLSSISRDIMENNENTTDHISNLMQTISQFYQMIYNPKLNESVFDISAIIAQSNVTQDDTANISRVTDPDEKINKEFGVLISKYEEKIKLLTEENNRLLKEIKMNNFKNNQDKEIQSLKEKLNNETNRNKDYENKINEMIKEYETKFISMDDDNKKLKADNENLAEQLMDAQKEIENKENIITYLEGFLKSNFAPQIFPNNDEEEQKSVKSLKSNEQPELENNIDYNNNNNEIMNEERKNSNGNFADNDNENELNNYLGGIYDKQNNMSDNENNDENNINEEEHSITPPGKNNNNPTDRPTERPKKIKKEIDLLDEEIMELKSKLKSLINKK